MPSTNVDESFDRLIRAVGHILQFVLHQRFCEIDQTDFCTCGLWKAKGVLSNAIKDYESAPDSAVRLKAENTALRQLARFATHPYCCDIDGTGKCDCGYEVALSNYRTVIGTNHAENQENKQDQEASQG